MHNLKSNCVIYFMDVVCVLGMPLSGKTTFSEKSKQMKIFTLTLDDIVREEIQKKGIIRTEEAEGKMIERLHNNPRELLRLITDKITHSGTPSRVVIEGFVNLGQIKKLAERLPGANIHIVAIHTPLKIRKSRQKSFIEKDTNIEILDEKAINSGVSDAIAMADHIIINDGSLEQFRQTVKNKLVEILNIDLKR